MPKEYKMNGEVNGVKFKVTLNLNEQAMVQKLPEALQDQVADSILKAKLEVQSTLISARSIFGYKINDVGNIVVTGLGNRFPAGFRPDSLRTLLGHSTELLKACDEAEAFVKANPEKVKAAQKARDEKKKAVAQANQPLTPGAAIAASLTAPSQVQ